MTSSSRAVCARVAESWRDLGRVVLSEALASEGVRRVTDADGRPLAWWPDPIVHGAPVRLTSDPSVHFGFPRAVRAADGSLLLFYRVGVSHASDDSSIAMRCSKDGGAGWSPERILWKDQPGWSAHNPVALVARSGRVVLWVSRFHYAGHPASRLPGLWSWSDDGGETWAPFTRFDTCPDRSSYYVTEAICTADGLLVAGATFPPAGHGNCYVLIWHSADDGRSWQVRSELTPPDRNEGDEAALLETEPGHVLCLLRDRQRKDLYRRRSRDGGRTWSAREALAAGLDAVVQRPFLTRLDGRTVLLTGRDYGRSCIVAYVSRDNAATFPERHVFDDYQKDGGYTSAVAVGPAAALAVWYSDHGAPPLRPDIHLAGIAVAGCPRQIVVKGVAAGQMVRLE